MEIYTVQPGDTINSIATKYNVSAYRVMEDNGINPGTLVIGQSLVILFPTETYTVKPGDSLQSIAEKFKITSMQLIRNNNHLANSKEVRPGENIVISYDNNIGSLITFGYCYNYIDNTVLEKTLPYLTYLCIFGAHINEVAELVINTNKELLTKIKSYSVKPILLLSSLIQQDLNYVDATYNILTKKEMLDKLINNIINEIKSYDYAGVCIVIEYLNSFNITIFVNYIKQLYKGLNQLGLKLFVTISPKNTTLSVADLRNIDDNIEDYLDGMIFMDYNRNIVDYPVPMPVTSIPNLRNFILECIKIIDENKMNIGCPVIGLDYELPYIPKKSNISYLQYTIVSLAYEFNAIIKFDTESQTPFFEYVIKTDGRESNHIVWFVNARTMNELINLIPTFQLNGTGLWNVMYYFAPIWSIINSQFKIIKLIPEL